MLPFIFSIRRGALHLEVLVHIITISYYWRKNKGLVIKTSWLGPSRHLCPELCELMMQAWVLKMLRHHWLPLQLCSSHMWLSRRTKHKNIINTNCEAQLCFLCLFVFKILLLLNPEAVYTWTSHSCVIWLSDRDTQAFRLTFTPTTTLKLPVNLTSRSLGCGRQLEFPERGHADPGKTQSAPSCCEETGPTSTLLPPAVIIYL